MHRSYVGRLERGESGVTVEALAAILAALGVSLGDFFSSFTKVVRPRTLQVRIVGAVLSWMFYETFEKFDDAVQTVHASLGISGTRQLMAFVGVADIFNGPIENLQALVQTL